MDETTRKALDQLVYQLFKWTVEWPGLSEAQRKNELSRVACIVVDAGHEVGHNTPFGQALSAAYQREKTRTGF